MAVLAGPQFNFNSPPYRSVVPATYSGNAQPLLDKGSAKENRREICAGPRFSPAVQRLVVHEALAALDASVDQHFNLDSAVFGSSFLRFIRRRWLVFAHRTRSYDVPYGYVTLL